MREKEISEKQQHDPKHVKMAVGIASDPRHKGGDHTGASKKIEKIAKGLSSHPQVAAVLRRQNEDVKEGLGDMAHMVEKDHEVQMARADLYKLAKYAIKLHDMLKGVSEAEGLEGWVQSKITKSADMIGSVYHHMDYENSPMGEVSEAANDCDETCPKSCPDCGGTGDPAKFKKSKTNEARDTHCSDKCCGSDVKAEDCTCPPTCKHCNCNAVAEGKYKNDAQRKAIHANKKKNETYKESLQGKLNAKLGK